MDLEQIIARMNAIVEEIKTCDNLETLGNLNKEYDDLNEKRSVIVEAQSKTPVKVEPRSVLPIANPNQTQVVEKGIGSKEYRSAFMAYVKTGKMSDILNEARADVTTKTSDISTLIPSTVMDLVIEKLKDYGQIYALVSKTNLKGGVSYPKSSTKPTATWVSEGSTAEKQKKTVTGTVTFGYHKLQIKMAVTLEATVVSIEAFEKVISDNMAEAIVVALEEAIINGTGVGQPLGIVKDTAVPAAQIVDFVAADAKWNGWKTKFFAKIPSAYRRKKTGVILTNQITFDTYIDGMVDSTGQPIARVNSGINGEEVYRFNGRLVIPTDTLPSFDEALDGEAFAVYVDLKDYTINSNMELTYRKYFNEETDEEISKLTLICDGKLVDANGIVVLKKKTA